MANPIDIDPIFAEQADHLRKLREIVKDSIREERSLIEQLEHPRLEKGSAGQRLADRVARFGGSWIFIVIFLIVLAGWILLNSVALGKEAFDPYPFILMNLVLSCIAALQAPVIMMSQNRQEEIDRKRAENDYLINLKAELEVRHLHQKVDLLLEDQIKTLFDIQARQMELLREIREKLN